MPHRVPRKAKRPKWNKEPDYWLREKARLKLLEQVRKTSDSFVETEQVCAGCDYKIWEAHRTNTITRGCHCITIVSPKGHTLYEFDPKTWALAVMASGVHMHAEQGRSGYGRN
jgi:hypothetical protein